MTKPRSQLIDVNETPYYHCICRCVRRAFLYGEDHLTGKRFDHRKEWVVERLALLSDTFSIDVCSYAVMSNHYHVVLRIDQHTAKDMNDNVVAKRWRRLYHWPLLVEKYINNKATRAEANKAKSIIQTWRERLHDISWFMRCLNEYLARKANLEDNCKGRFWESRFKSQALLGEAAVLTCMSYVDLNPIRASIAKAPEEFDHTSIQQRINKIKPPKVAKKMKAPSKDKRSPVKLMPLVKAKSDKHPNAIGYTLKDYLELIDWVGRSVRNDKRGAIDQKEPPILNRLGLNTDEFIDHVLTKNEHVHYPCATGPLDRLKELAAHWKQNFIKGQYSIMRIYHTAKA